MLLLTIYGLSLVTSLYFFNDKHVEEVIKDESPELANSKHYRSATILVSVLPILNTFVAFCALIVYTELNSK